VECLSEKRFVVINNHQSGGERVKAVLISIRPEWCDRIARGEKTIEIRKNKPNIEPPFKCYIYETKAINRKKIIVDLDGELPTIYARGSGKVIGEFICDRIEEFESEFYSSDNVLNAIYRVVEDEDYPGERIYTSIATNEKDSENFWICTLSCLSFEEIKKYIGYAKRETVFYGWHIAKLVIYDKPKELNSFYCRKLLTRPPQSWCYVEEVSE
jgi:predicted transcriptional regulator